MPAEYEVRITPLLLGVEGLLEDDTDGITTITEEETTLVAQFAEDDFEVNMAINDGVTGRVTLSVYDPAVESLEPFAQAVRVAYKRPDGDDAEAILFGPCNVTTDYEAGTVTLVIADAALRCQHHYVRRGDIALNLDDDRGALPAHADSINQIIDAARNTTTQQDRGVPALACTVTEFGDFPDPAEDMPLVEFERGQEVWDLGQQVLRADTGPCAYSFPLGAWAFPLSSYCTIGLFDPPTDPTSPGEGELGRNLDPIDPDDPQPGEVIFDYGCGLDNLISLVEAPGRPTTHVHVLDADRDYRVTAADSASSEDVGVFVDWIATDFKVVDGDTDALTAIANARIKGWGRPPKHFTCVLRPDDAQPYHYGNRLFSGDTTGDFQIGDYIRVRAERGYRSFSTLARITAVKFTFRDGLPALEVSMVPAVGGDLGDGSEEA